MAFTPHNNLETVDTGTQNWDSSINDNFEHLEKGITIKATAGLTLTKSQVTYIDSNGEFQLAIADGSIANKYIGIATTAINKDVDGYAQNYGYHLDANWSWTVGNPLYLSAVTPGALTESEPAESIMVGVAIATNQITVRPWVQPDPFPHLRTDNFRSSSGLTVTGTLAVSDIVPKTGESTLHIIAGVTITGDLTITGDVVADHSVLDNLTADDHTQYLLTNPTRSTSGLTCDGTFSTMDNLGVGTIDQFGAGIGIVGLADAATIPSEDPTGGGCLYSIGGALIWRGSAGTTTLIANA
jgi:hypothetical protein